MAITWELSTIRDKVRRYTGRPNSSQISDDDIDNFIDDYYLNLLPLQTGSTFFDAFSGSAGFTATTVDGTGEYALDSTTLIGIKKPVLIDGDEIPLWFDIEKFLLRFPPSVTDTSKPTDALLWERELFLRPIPDDNDGDNYDIEAPAVDLPSSLTGDTDQPVDALFGRMLALGASILLLGEYAQTDRLTELAPLMRTYEIAVFRKEITAFKGRSSIPSF